MLYLMLKVSSWLSKPISLLILMPPHQPSEIYACYCDAVDKVLCVIPIFHGIIEMEDYNLSGHNWTVILVLTLLAG
ncbi:hypothetical protein J6590_048526 [Homalodisca vitripennis]|nr:hypothetical protein J6590_048526 [Homalodisca vitripennis]